MKVDVVICMRYWLPDVQLRLALLQNDFMVIIFNILVQFKLINFVQSAEEVKIFKIHNSLNNKSHYTRLILYCVQADNNL